MANGRVVYTIGHSNHTAERFVGLLRQHEITAIVDVRSVPYSRMHPQFDQKSLTEVLREQSIAYVFLGRELGGRSDDPACYENGRVQYQLLAHTRAFREGIERVCTGSKNHRISLICAEREPLDCHRTLLISRELERVGIKVVHIHADGHLESHEEAIKRLIQRLGMPEQDLFRTQAEIIDEAYLKQEARIAYVDEQMTQEARERRS